MAADMPATIMGDASLDSVVDDVAAAADVDGDADDDVVVDVVVVVDDDDKDDNDNDDDDDDDDECTHRTAVLRSSTAVVDGCTTFTT